MWQILARRAAFLRARGGADVEGGLPVDILGEEENFQNKVPTPGAHALRQALR